MKINIINKYLLIILMENNQTDKLKSLEKMIELYKIKMYKQQLIINQLKNRLDVEEMIKKSYIHKLSLRSKL